MVKQRYSKVGSWAVLFLAAGVPIVAAAFSPLLEWREPTYIVAGFAGIVAMALMVFQPLLARGLLTATEKNGRNIHRWLGTALVITLAVHVIGLWITSPPDVVDALLFVSATPFSVWGVTAMWSVFFTAGLVFMRHQFRLKMKLWRNSHQALAVVTVIATVLHAIQIEGTMEVWSKYGLCVVLVVTTLWTIFKALIGKTSSD